MELLDKYGPVTIAFDASSPIYGVDSASGESYWLVKK